MALRTAASQPSLSFPISWSLLKLMSIESVIPSNHLMHCRPLHCYNLTRAMTGSERCTRPKIIPESCFWGFRGMITLANQRDDNWPISKCQETPAANQPLPPPCLCSKLINTAVNLGSGLLFYSTVLDVTGALARASNKPLYAFALLWMSYSLSFGDSDTGHNNSMKNANIFICWHF